MSTQVILLERVEKLGNLGDVVAVKPGYARNYLLPQKKALRASKDNIAYFESQKKHLASENDKLKAEAEKLAKTIKGTTVSLIRAASESGQLYGSVTSRDIAAGLREESGVSTIRRSNVKMSQNYKLIGLFPIEIILHPEVIVEVTINIARTKEEAQMQAKSGKALISDGSQDVAPEKNVQPADDALKAALDDEALEAQKDRQSEADEKAVEDAAKAEEKAAKKAEKDAAKLAARAAEDAVEAEEAQNNEDVE